MEAGNVWWCSIDKDWSSYLELKYRKVIAQGWRELGSLSFLCDGYEDIWQNNKDDFCKILQYLGKGYYGSDWWDENTGEWVRHGKDKNAPTVMYNLLSIQQGDLVVATEGQSVKGICQIQKNGWESYRYDGDFGFEYAQTVGGSVEWMDWDTNIFGPPPPRPAMVLGVRRIRKNTIRTVEAWNQLILDNS
jgi:hypothetical protein